MAPQVLPRGLRLRLEAQLLPRPWPPPRTTAVSAALAATLDRLAQEHGSPAGRTLPLPEDWIVLVDDEIAAGLKSLVLGERLLVAGIGEWERLPQALRRDTERHVTLARLDVIHAEADWLALLPEPARGAGEGRGPLLAVRSRVAAAGVPTIASLHVWSAVSDEPVLQEDVSGVLKLGRAPGRA